MTPMETVRLTSVPRSGSSDDLPVSNIATIEAMRDLKAQRRALEVRELVLAAHDADLNAVLDETAPVLPGHETLRRFGGDGMPEVAEFAVLELAAALGMRDAAAAVLLGLALDLRHRLPSLWQMTLADQVPAWQAREIASATRDLDEHHAGLGRRSAGLPDGGPAGACVRHHHRRPRQAPAQGRPGDPPDRHHARRWRGSGTG